MAIEGVPDLAVIQQFCNGCDNLNEEGSCELDKRHTNIQENAARSGKLRRTDFYQQLDPPLKDGVDQRAAGYTDQQRYVLRQWCGWASVDGKRGDMTPEGFVPRTSK